MNYMCKLTKHNSNQIKQKRLMLTQIYVFFTIDTRTLEQTTNHEYKLNMDFKLMILVIFGFINYASNNNSAL